MMLKPISMRSGIVFPFFLFFLGSCSGLRLLSLRVPAHKLQAGAATLRCVFDVQGATLYSVQWYKDGAEFYRYMPADTPPKQYFPLPGVTVDLQESGSMQVMLRLLTLDSSGVYRCEVSTEAPLFLTVAAQAHMLIMALPREAPRLKGLGDIYSNGEPVDVNCTSARSKPAATLTWYINEKEVSEFKKSDSGPWLSHYRVRHIAEDRLEEATLGLRLAAQPKFFHNNVMHLRCTATLGALQWHTQSWSVLNFAASGMSKLGFAWWMLVIAVFLLHRLVL